MKKVTMIHQTARSDAETSADSSTAPTVMLAKNSTFTSAIPNKAQARARSGRGCRLGSMYRG
jgi:hypothetical protein